MNATKKEIKSRYYELAQRHHPDKTGSKTNEFLRIKNAYEILSKDQVNEYGGQSQKQKWKSNNRNDFEPSKILSSSILFGIGFIVFNAMILVLSLTESRSLAIDEAWEEYARNRKKDGLDIVLGYESKKSSD